MLLNQAIKSFVMHMEVIDRSKETIRGYGIELKNFNKFITIKHNCPVYVEDIKLQDLEDYLLHEKRVEKLSQDPKSYAPGKVVSIITAFEEEDIDPKVVAKQQGFKDHIEMAGYMKNKGYEWNVYRNNYVKTVGKVEGGNDAAVPPQEPTDQPAGGNVSEGINEYLPFIRFLYEKRDLIYQLLSGTREDGKIPRYAVPGLVRTKAIYMSDMVAKLAGEFSREKNVTQREIVEAALVEYLQKYGFKREVEALLKNQ